VRAELIVELRELLNIARKVADAYSEQNRKEGRREWTVENYLTGFVGDVGDLSKLLMAKSGYRYTENVDERIGHELSDCLWSILLIADELSLDLGMTYKREMDRLLTRITSEDDRSTPAARA
jgi:NTP pyrophosphatase (non-canonical NTP hydrolase)